MGGGGSSPRLTAEGLLQASELHGGPVGREPDVVQVGWGETREEGATYFLFSVHTQAVAGRGRENLTQRLVELGHLGMIPTCCLGLVAEMGQKGQVKKVLLAGFPTR